MRHQQPWISLPALLGPVQRRVCGRSPQFSRKNLCPNPISKTCLPNASAAGTTAKSTAIYKFEKIKRAKRAAMAAHPGAEIIDMGVGEPDEMAFPEVVEKLVPGSAQAGESRVCRQRRRRAEAGRRPLPGPRLRRAGHQSRDRGDPFHRQQGRALHPAGRADQSRRLCPDDHARLPGVWHARQVLRRRWCTTCR